jgi:hypothetical protein
VRETASAASYPTSHELRSPITVVRQHAEVALAHPDRVAAAELAEVVLAEQHACNASSRTCAAGPR